MGKDWHPECFNCTKCHIPLSPDNFFEKNGKPYCEKDYYDLFSPKCYACLKPIKGRVSELLLITPYVLLITLSPLFTSSHCEPWARSGTPSASSAPSARFPSLPMPLWRRTASRTASMTTTDSLAPSAVPAISQLRRRYV